MSMKINVVEAENVKRLKAFRMEPSANGLTVIGGKNNQGKTSVLDTITWALGGDKYRPTQPQREGSVLPPYIRVVMSNGLVVERKGKNSELKVIDPEGRKGGQQLLNEFIEQLALDLPKFMNSSSRDKAETLLQIIGVGPKLRELEQKETEAYNRRRAVGQIADQKKKFAKEQPYFPDAPKEPVSASELIRRQQDILAKNGENQRKRDQALSLHAERNRLAEKVNALREELDRYEKQLTQADADMTTAYKTSEQLQDESTEELERDIANIETINRKVRANLDKEKAEDDAREYENQYNTLSAELDGVRQAKLDLLKNAPLPLPGLSVEDGELTYNGHRWDSMSGSDQLRVSTAIVRRLNPKCGFVLLDKLEQMDLDTLREFGAWLESEGMQAIATRVSTGDECSVIIEDGTAGGIEPEEPAAKWKAGEF